MLHYESPIQKDYNDIPKAVIDKFENTSLFEIPIKTMKQLWKTLSDNGYVTQTHFSLLTGGEMYPDLDRTFLYCFVRHIKPQIVIEVGAGESTHVIRSALQENQKENSKHNISHIAIEPYRHNAVPNGVEVIKKELQLIPNKFFTQLQSNDILFIDSSHVIMPYGDTLVELITILPNLQKGVYVHFHDIFLPFDYLKLFGKQNRMYTEQWAVGLMLYGAGATWEVIWASWIMSQKYKDVILSMPHYPKKDPSGGSLWIRKIK